MTSDELQVLLALEVGLECAEEVLILEESNSMAFYRPRRLEIAKKEVQQIVAAIEVVKRWETKE